MSADFRGEPVEWIAHSMWMADSRRIVAAALAAAAAERDSEGE